MARTLTTAPESASALAPKSAPWIYGPWVDMLAGCGAWSAPLLLLSFYASSGYSRAWAVAFYFLALFFNYPHFMATVYRAYHTHSEFQKYRIFTIHAALLLALAGVIAHLWYPLLPWIFTLYICWSPWHYTGQNFGLLMMFARRSGIAPSSAERNAIHLSFIASFVLLMLSFHTGPSGDPMILSLGLPAKLTLPARGILALFFLGASGWALVSMARRSGLRAIVAPATLALTQFLWFLLPAAIEIFSGREVPQTRYSSGILAVLHSAQYLWITSYYQAREARASGEARWSFSRYLLTLVAGGVALFIPGPWIASRLFHADFAASFLTFTALVNIHHFILDGALWKLRDSRVAAFLLHSSGEGAAGNEESRSGLQSATQWLTGSAPIARALRIGTVALLLFWAGMDQLHFYWSSEAENLSALERAAKLNPNDSSVQVRLARAESEAGNREGSLAALQRAAAISPGNFSQQEAFARGLIETGHIEEAHAQYEKILARWPQNANALVNYGLLAQRLGHGEEAIDSWQRAIAGDPGQPQAQICLAQALDQRGETQAAARHYRAYLQIVAAHQEEHRGEAATVIAALVKVADADAAASHASDALTGYNAAIRFAEKANDKALESLGLAHLADLHEKQGNAVAAADAYQKALTIDTSLADPLGAGTDWLNYGQFLKRQRQPERLVFACLLRAEELARTTPGAALAAIVDARSESEVRLGREAAVVRRSTAPLLQEALTLPVGAFSQGR
ncbi:MAG TPA: tetratricopeptide repeat protein [Candidatus Angelobacter sp.]|nr:tetratricopeptide repeat protein [Candidatus Angelobacter sp.]